jgi:cation transport protein ChaC
MQLTRESLLAGELMRLVAAQEGAGAMTAEDMRRSRDEVLARHPAGHDLWLFAYGSLIWNPTFHHVERQVARLHGFHRRFCLWTRLGRGTLERPGLTLGLDRGGSCSGVVFRIAAAAVETELDAIWRREMVTNAYSPTWVKVRARGRMVPAVTFVINRAHPRYAPALCDDEAACVIAVAEGELGSCRDYLFNTVTHLEALGIQDRGLARLAETVRARREAGIPEEPAPAQELGAQDPGAQGLGGRPIELR